MANKLKKNTIKNPEKKPAKSDVTPFREEKEEKIDLKAIARDERTWKIVGAVSIVLSVFLFISFASYLFTWKQDQAVAQQGFGALLGSDVTVANLLGRFGAVISHFFIFKAFGIASFLICTFFFVVGVNLLFRRKVFSIWRNLKYVTVGLLVLSVSLSFLFAKSAFPFGGGVGDMINRQLTGVLGTIGTAAVLLLLALGYFIWQFNPAFNLPVKKNQAADTEAGEQTDETMSPVTANVSTQGNQSINDLYAAKAGQSGAGNSLKGEGGITINFPDEGEVPLHEFKLTEKEEKAAEMVEKIEAKQPTPEQEIVNEIMHTHEFEMEETEEETPLIIEEYVPPVKEKPVAKKPDEPLELEIKAAPEKEPEEEISAVENLPPYEPTLDLRDYKYPTLSLLETHGSEKIIQDTNELENNKNQIIATLRNYSIEIQKISATVGPTVTLYEIVPAPGVRISKIKNLEDDIALSLAALGIRIIAPIPGKGTIGIEVPNVRKTVVSMKTLLASDKFQNNNFSLPIAIGKRIDNENFIVDLASMPHLLMAGATGQGKSVGLNAILVSLLYKKHPSQMKFVLIDPKKVELSIYRTIEHHFLAKLPGEEDAIITDTKKVVHTLNALCIEMDNRYDLLKEAGARNIKEYNEKFIKRKLNPQKGHQYLPFIVLVIDEFADLIMTAGKEIEMPIARLAQLARAIGIHLIIATQRPSVNIITGTIKANFPARVGFKVSSKIDSRTILDTGGAEQLIGKGDMLISHNGEVTRLQCAFVDTPEVEQVVDFIGNQRGYPQAFLLPEYVDEKELEGKDFDLADRDSLFEDAARLIVQNQVGSTSLLQRRMKLGYNRAGRLMDQLEAAGIVGPNQGSKARDVLIKTEMDLQQHLDAMG
ncbi:MAG: DNA translocase FtsK [Chitinophagaceae bacterium]|nr:DNA translocase FtsK [Chitinophagaceae bacterium]